MKDWNRTAAEMKVLMADLGFRDSNDGGRNASGDRSVSWFATVEHKYTFLSLMFVT
jgi:hypothetical protein